MGQPDTMDTIDRKIVSDVDKIKYVEIGSNKYCITQLVEDLEWLYKTVSFSKSFSDYILFVNKSKKTSLNCPVAATIYDSNLDIAEKNPFMKYKETVKCKYRDILCALKHLYKTYMELPDVEHIKRTITIDFHIENDIFLKHPDFIMDHFIYHTYCHNHISDNYEKVLNVIKVFEYLYYKTINYVAELEFDLETNTQPCYIDRSYT